jgi:hypothetical protein
MQGSTELTVAPIRRPVGRVRINGPDEVVTARFREGTLARIKAALADKEPQSDFIREAVEAELERRAKGR